MKLKSKSALLMALVVMVGATAGYVSRTYAKYTAAVSASGTATVAQWAFEDNNQIDDFVIDLSSTVQEGTIAQYEDEGGNDHYFLAPGTSGHFDIELSNGDSDVAVDYEISLSGISNAPANIHFYSDDTLADQYELTDSSGNITGTLEANDSTVVTKTIYWEWVYEEIGATSSSIDYNDGLDTNYAIFEQVEERTITVTVSVYGVQHNPTVSMPA